MLLFTIFIKKILLNFTKICQKNPSYVIQKNNVSKLLVCHNIYKIIFRRTDGIKIENSFLFELWFNKTRTRMNRHNVKILFILKLIILKSILINRNHLKHKYYELFIDKDETLLIMVVVRVENHMV